MIWVEGGKGGGGGFEAKDREGIVVVTSFKTRPSSKREVLKVLLQKETTAT